MKRRELGELRGKDSAELRKLLIEKRQELAKIRLDLVLKKTKNMSLVPKSHRSIAQILTILKEKK